ncbi:MAG: hypothetical protein ACRC6M_16190 [Microcystaceae cyanobacterium]
MQAQRLILETDQAGNLKQIPKLPPNKQIEGIFFVLSDISEKSPPQNVPHPDLAGKVQILTEIFESVPDTDWEILQ